VALNLKTYEGQTILSTALAVLGAVASVATWGLLVRRFDRTAFYVSFNFGGALQPVLGLGLLVGLGAGVIGFFMALNSAGQKRNTRSALAWKSFFLNALVITLALSAVVFFFFTRNPVSLKDGM